MKRVRTSSTDTALADRSLSPLLEKNLSDFASLVASAPAHTWSCVNAFAIPSHLCADPVIAKLMLRLGMVKFQELSPMLRARADVVRESAQDCGGVGLGLADPAVWEDAALVQDVMKATMALVKPLLDHELLVSEKFMRTAVEVDANLVQHAPASVTSDVPLMTRVCAKNPRAVMYASGAAQADKGLQDVLGTIVAREKARFAGNHRGYADVDAKLRTYPGLNRELLAAALPLDPYALDVPKMIIGDGWERDRDLVLFMCSHNGHVLRNLSAALKDDADIVRAAVSSRYGACIRHASANLRQDRDLWLLAAQNPHEAVKALGYAPKEIKQDAEIVEAAIRCTRGKAFRSVSAEHRSDLRLAKLAKALGFTDIGRHLAPPLRDRVTSGEVSLDVQENDRLYLGL